LKEIDNYNESSSETNYTNNKKKKRNLTNNLNKQNNLSENLNEEKISKNNLTCNSKCSELKEITKSNFSESFIKVVEKNNIENSIKLESKNSSHSNYTSDSCPTTVSGSFSIKTRSGVIKKKENDQTIFLNKKRNYDNIDEKNPKLQKKNKNLVKNAHSIINQKESNLNKEKNVNKIKNIRKASITSMTDDEILAYQTPDKKEDFTKLKYSPNTVSRKNLMELFKQIKKNEN